MNVPKVNATWHVSLSVVCPHCEGNINLPLSSNVIENHGNFAKATDNINCLWYCPFCKEHFIIENTVV